MSLVTVSIVNHGHEAFLPALLEDIDACPEVGKIILTDNLAESKIKGCLPEKVLMLRNLEPKGFGMNHNFAAKKCNTPYFCILNPDVRFEGNPFTSMLEEMKKKSAVLSGPCVVNQTGGIEDSARRFPTPINLITKITGLHNGSYDYKKGDPSFCPDWIAGMFMLCKMEDYLAVGGFDEKYFLYYEDVDLCVRLWKSGRQIIICPGVSVIHTAQRASHMNCRYFIWHISSMFRFFRLHWCRLPHIQN